MTNCIVCICAKFQLERIPGGEDFISFISCRLLGQFKWIKSVFVKNLHKCLLFYSFNNLVEFYSTDFARKAKCYREPAHRIGRAAYAHPPLQTSTVPQQPQYPTIIQVRRVPRLPRPSNGLDRWAMCRSQVMLPVLPPFQDQVIKRYLTIVTFMQNNF